ncbi:MAG: hypothetical protein PF480_06150 [Roseovarius sp.]|jgi:hypothetical protein|nr:hypothetical protein [Roseovarius sp.]
MRRLLVAWRNHPWLVSGFLTAFGVTLFFTARMITSTVYWSDPEHRDQTIQGWMTPGYVARSWSIPRSELETALSDFIQPGEHLTLDQIADNKDIGVIARFVR